MELIKKIIEKSREVDNRFENMPESELDSFHIEFCVPPFHPRAKMIKSYPYACLTLESLPQTQHYKSSRERIFLIDNTVSKLSFVKSFIEKKGVHPHILGSSEDKVKTMEFLDTFIKDNDLTKREGAMVVAIGGGLLLNVAAYISEKLNSPLIIFPTTALAMADLAGGKVRVNAIVKSKFYKHYYKSYYEPDAIYIDSRFLDYLPEKQIKIGLAEIIKHGLAQSPKLYDFLSRSGKTLLRDRKKLKKAIFWACDLKRACLEIDVEENMNGSRSFLRMGHDFSDKIEEEMKLKIPHGFAVAIGIIKQLEFEKDEKALINAKKIFQIFDIPTNIEEYNKLSD
ncbi:MAG: iron-containing alcohol dehydrogenase [Nanoarchaeota archaeon]